MVQFNFFIVFLVLYLTCLADSYVMMPFMYILQLYLLYVDLWHILN